MNFMWKWYQGLAAAFRTPQSVSDKELRDFITRMGLWIALLTPLTYGTFYLFIDYQKFWVPTAFAFGLNILFIFGLLALKRDKTDIAKILLIAGSYVTVSSAIFLFFGVSTGLNEFLLVFSLFPVIFWHFTKWPYMIFFFLLNMITYVVSLSDFTPVMPLGFPHEVAHLFRTVSTVSAWALILLLFLIQQAATARNELKLSVTNDEKSRFFRLLAHDLRGPMGSLMNTLRYMNQTTPNLDKEQSQHFLTQLETGSQNLYALMDNLLTWAESTQGAIPYRPKEVLVDTLFHELEDLYFTHARKKLIKLKIPHFSGFKLQGDPDQLMSILRNLVGNALKFTPRGGLVEVFVDQNHQGTTFTVQDTGAGISPGLLETLMSPGLDVRRPGTEGEPGSGLGLLICREFARQHSATILFQNRPTGGAEFAFTVPIANGDKLH